ncbi:sulfite exporter TauE/SafE family protein [Ochrobactrum haematophilum]|uniref:Probable membrane transporter protein n=2 Tax=Brucella haematophila TaxID=419474 RepID=A0ABX1DP93_9HYPH|nr:sulfite exporter TauE/SafE family protein [Brucella haematophila]
MGIYLPIAELSVNMLVLLSMGAAVGFLSGLFGVGGGFLITPLLIFYNIPPAIAVATGANQVIASSVSGALVHFKRRTLDIKLGLFLVAGGIVGSLLGIFVFSWLRELGQLDLIVSILYVFFLGSVGGLMLVESLRALRRVKKGGAIRRPGQHTWIHKLPFKMRFRASTIYVSIIPVLGIGFFIGLLSSVMGVGGGFIMVPALIYLLHVPTNVVVGTSLFQITFVTAFTTVMQATTNQSIDIVLAFLLMVGGVIGAQYGARAGQKLRGEQLRLLLALLVLAVALRLAFGLFVRPDNLFSITIADFLRCGPLLSLRQWRYR